MRTRGCIVPLVCALSSSSAAQVTATPQRPSGVVPNGALAPSSSLREHFGIDLAARLLRSSNADERLRGIERAAAIGTPEAVSLLIHAAREPLHPQEPDTRALLLIVRGLADATNQSEARSFLRDGVLGGALHTHAGATSTEPESEDSDRDVRLALARSMAALALATSPDPRAVEAVLQVARDPGPGQAAAIEAILASPPEQVAAMATGPMPPVLLRLAAEMGDLRTLDAVRAALHASDAATRAAALDAISETMDTRGLVEARSMIKDPDPLVRQAAARALVRLGAPERLRVVEALIADDETADEGLRLAGIASDAGVAKALAARTVATSQRDSRSLAVVALGRCQADEAVQALMEFVKDPLLESDATAALARSPSPRAKSAIQSLLRTPATRRLGARAYTMRAFTRGDAEEWGGATLTMMAQSFDARDRAVGLGGLVLLGKRDPAALLGDPDAGVRQAVAIAAMADVREVTRRSILRASREEPDPIVRRVEMSALVGGDADGLITTGALAERATGGEADGPLATMALAARADPTYREEVDALLTSSDPIARAHAARGLGYSAEANATGRLAHAYAFEIDPLVRRAIVSGLGRRWRDADAPALLSVLKKAARLDPDQEVRQKAAQALAGVRARRGPRVPMEVAWVRLSSSAGRPWDGIAAHLHGGQLDSRTNAVGMLLRADGVAVPVAFDADGYALVPIPPGQARLLLEPRVPAYERAAHE
jgi:HEAT repeat protein